LASIDRTAYTTLDAMAASVRAEVNGTFFAMVAARLNSGRSGNRRSSSNWPPEVSG
jgi:hypothetical protein